MNNKELLKEIAKGLRRIRKLGKFRDKLYGNTHNVQAVVAMELLRKMGTK